MDAPAPGGWDHERLAKIAPRVRDLAQNGLIAEVRLILSASHIDVLVEASQVIAVQCL